MSKDNPARPSNEPNLSPASQADESKGTIKQPQQTDATMRENDVAQGSEFGAGKGGGGPQKPGRVR